MGFKYFDIRELLTAVPDAQIYMVHGERSNGKTYSTISYAVERFVKYGETFVYVRRLAESIRAAYMRQLLAGNRATGDLSEKLKLVGYDDIIFYSGAFWPAMRDEKSKLIRCENPCGYTMAISTWETAKGGSIPDAETIIFDEYLTRGAYFPNEPTMFENLISNIVRNRATPKVIMLANTVSWSAPYYREWGLNHIRDMKQGTYDIYDSGDHKRKIVVCYAAHTGAKASDVYFNFDNPRSRMITTGVWETADYVKIPDEVNTWDKGEPCYIQSIEGWACKIVPVAGPDGTEAIIVYPLTRNIIDQNGVDIRYRDRIIYTDYFFHYINCRMAMTKHTDNYSKFLIKCLREGRVFYANNEVGENVRNYLKWSTSYSPIPN